SNPDFAFQPQVRTCLMTLPECQRCFELGILDYKSRCAAGNFQPDSPTAMTASVRFDTFNALSIAVTGFFLVGSAKLRTRKLALLFCPCNISASTSSCPSVNRR